MNATFACIPPCLDPTILWNIKTCLFIAVSNFWKAPVSTMYSKLVSRHPPPPFVLFAFNRIQSDSIGFNGIGFNQSHGFAPFFFSLLFSLLTLFFFGLGFFPAIFGLHRLVCCLGTTFNLLPDPFEPPCATLRHPALPLSHPPTRFCLSFLSLVSNTWRVGEAPLLLSPCLPKDGNRRALGWMTRQWRN